MKYFSFILISVLGLFFCGCGNKTKIISTYPNGEKKEELIIIEKNTYTKILYYQNGKIDSVGKYINGRANGMFDKYSDKGNLEAVRTYSNDSLNGLFVLYFENKIHRQIKYFKNGKPDGLNISLL